MSILDPFLVILGLLHICSVSQACISLYLQERVEEDEVCLNFAVIHLFSSPELNMDKIVIGSGFSLIHGLEFRPNPTKWGLKLMHHVHNVRETRYTTDDKTIITACCLKRMKLKGSYNVRFELDKDRKVIKGPDTKCFCPAGRTASCKHGAAVYFYVNEERTETKTDQPMTFKSPSEHCLSIYKKAKGFRELWPGRQIFHHNYRVPSDEAIQKIKDVAQQIQMTEGSMFKTWTVDIDEADDEDDIIFLDDAVLGLITMDMPLIPTSIPFIQAQTNIDPQARAYFNEKVQISNSQAEIIFRETIRQAESHKWHCERRPRITASKARKILKGTSADIRWKHFITVPKDNKNFQYGRTHERAAKIKYQELFPTHTLHESGKLARVL